VPAEAGWALALGMLGAIVGSFLANLVVRWTREQSVVRGRSACDRCGRVLGVRELVPLASWVVQQGRCRSCGARIDPRHPAIEAGCVLAGVAAGLVAPGWEGAAGAVFGWLLLTLAAIDASDLWLPDELTAALALTGAASGLAFAPAPADRVIGGLGGFAALWVVAFAYRHLRGREGLGGGDPKLFGAIGVWLGWQMLPAVLLLAGLIGLGVALFQHLRGRDVAADTALPLGTFLAAAAYPAWLAMVGWRA
jgi:leader peptidase (prepilin peptidase)/N-methyltransferase